MVIAVELFLEFIAIPHDTKATVELPVHISIACFGALHLNCNICFKHAVMRAANHFREVKYY